MKMIKTLLLAASLLIVSQAQAAFVTTNEAALDAVFSQASFGNNTIDIRIGATTELVFPSLLDVNLNAEVGQLFGQHVGPANVVNFYFIDTLSACGGQINVNFVGCGELPGNDFVVESAFAAGGNGGELLAHELGHNLGLGHRNGNNLMDPFINGFTDLNAAEVATILGSNLVQSDNNGLFILINPVLIVAAAIPEPSIIILLLSSIALMGFNRKRKAK